MPDREPLAEALLGNAPSIVALRQQIARLAAFDAVGSPRVPTVLIVGETGTGKGLVARVIHDAGPRTRGPFVDVNCGAIPDTMLEAELFGFEAGAFTDAKRAKPGLFEAASGGTLFLDEIDSLSPAVQGKLLKAIEEKRVRRLGAVTAHDVDVKLVTATQHDLTALVAVGRFRADLYHRLALLVLPLPPLRARQDDIVLLAEHFLGSFAAAHGLPSKRIDASAAAWLRIQQWPGNVRELGHLMERATLLCADATIDRSTLVALSPAAPTRGTATNDTAGHGENVDEAERIQSALVRSGGNVVRAAALLGIGRNALRYRMRRLGIDREGVTAPAGGGSGAAVTEPARATLLEIAQWEQKPIAVVIMSMTLPPLTSGATYDPWTAASRWQRAIVDRIEGFGGHVVQESHSRFVAVFGVPRALEQMSQRASHAVVAIQQSMTHATGPRPTMHAVIHVGEARIDAAAQDPLARLLPIDDTFTLPDRLLGHAGAGEVLVSAVAARRLERSWELHARPVALGPNPGDRITAYTLVRQHAATDTGQQAGAEASSFVGRGRELGMLHDAFARVAEGRGQAVFIAGDAGIGKSRLIKELRAQLAAKHRWIEGRCAAYGKAIPFLPIIDGMRRHLGIDDEDDETVARAKISAELDRLGTDLGWTDPFVRQLLSFDVTDDTIRELDSASRRSELFRALRALTLRAAEIEPLVLVIEDLHWIDLASEEYLTFLSDVIPTTRLLLILTHRPGYQQPFGERSYFMRLSLLPLSHDDVATITGGILGCHDVPAELRALIASKAEGNPFFAEELTKSLLEDGTLRREQSGVSVTRVLRAVTVPDSIQDVLIARIDRLAEASRQAIQIAAVIGREFALRLLARITEVGDRIQTQVDELRGLELIYEKALHPELAYMFKHALTHDVAYESVLHERRIALHRTIGHAIEELYADRLAEHYEILAHHFSRGEDWERAITYLERSADKAAETYANRAVIEHCRQALAFADMLGDRIGADTRRRLYERIGRASSYLSDFGASGKAFEQAAECSGDDEARALFLGSAAYSYFWNHDYAASQRCSDAAATLSRERQLPAGAAMALVVQSFYSGVHDADLDAYERGSRHAIDLCARHPQPAIEALARFQLAQIAEWTGAYSESVVLAEQVLVMGRALRLPDLIIFPTWFLGKARCCLGDFGGALAQLDEAYQMCDRIGDRAWKSRLLNTMGWCLAEIGSVDRARQCNEGAAALARELGDPEILVNANVNLAMNTLALGLADHARAQMDPIEEMLASSTDPWMRWRYGLHVFHARGAVALAQGALETALSAGDLELRHAIEHRAPKIAARAHGLRAAALLAMDRRDDAESALSDARIIAERIGHQRARWEVHRGLAQLARRRGDVSAAERHASAARTLAERSAQSLADVALRHRLIDAVNTEVWLP
jgi:DNA-binding NtrC family response regulator/tetratricopeptide (TPR) repeat protein